MKTITQAIETVKEKRLRLKAELMQAKVKELAKETNLAARQAAVSNRRLEKTEKALASEKKLVAVLEDNIALRKRIGELLAEPKQDKREKKELRKALELQNREAVQLQKAIAKLQESNAELGKAEEYYRRTAELYVREERAKYINSTNNLAEVLFDAIGSYPQMAQADLKAIVDYWMDRPTMVGWTESISAKVWRDSTQEKLDAETDNHISAKFITPK